MRLETIQLRATGAIYLDVDGGWSSQECEDTAKAVLRAIGIEGLLAVVSAARNFRWRLEGSDMSPLDIPPLPRAALNGLFATLDALVERLNTQEGLLAGMKEAE